MQNKTSYIFCFVKKEHFKDIFLLTKKPEFIQKAIYYILKINQRNLYRDKSSINTTHFWNITNSL